LEDAGIRVASEPSEIPQLLRYK